MKFALTILLALAFSGAATAQTLSPEQIKAIVAAPDRTAADRTNDQRRHPEDILAFLALRPGLTALDLSAGGGYTTELLARALGPTGKVYGQSRPRPATPPPAPTNPEGNANPSAKPAAARRRASRQPTPWKVSGQATFSSALSVGSRLKA